MRERIREWIAARMAGRNGMDELGYVCIGIYAVTLLAANMTVSWVPLIICLVTLIFGFYRLFSKNLERRRSENEAFLNLFRPIAKLFRKKNRTVRCKNCGTKVKVPVEQTSRTITCPNCRRTIR